MASSNSTVDDGGQPRTKKDRVVMELRRLIAVGELARGSRIQQDDLAKLFKTSITPVREAMRQLEAEGLLVSEPHRGVRVAFADIEEVKGVYIARRLLEPYAAVRSVLRVTRRDLASADRLTNAMEEARAAGDSPRLLDTNREFHFLFYDRCGIPSLSAVIGTLWLAYPWDTLHVIQSRVSDSVAEHREMIAAVEGGDEQAVREAFEIHIRNSYFTIARHLTGPAAGDPYELDVD